MSPRLASLDDRTRPEFMNRPRSGTAGGLKVVGSNVLASYWKLAAERQRVYHARLCRRTRPWTDNAIVYQYRFTNAYRAADRISQDLIRVLYAGSQYPDDLLLLQTLLYWFFNKPETWQAMESALGEVSAADFDPKACGAILDQALAQGGAGLLRCVHCSATPVRIPTQAPRSSGPHRDHDQRRPRSITAASPRRG